MSDFSQRLRSLRGDESQRSVATKAGVSHTSIARAERGTRLLRLDTLERLCHHYEVSFFKMIGLMGEARQGRDLKKAKGE